MAWFRNDKDEQDARIALLTHYSRVLVSHGVYILTVVLGILGLFEVLPNLSPASITIGNQEIISVRNLIMSIGLSVLIALKINLIGRLFFWSYMTDAVSRVKPIKEIEIKKGTTGTLLYQLDRACYNYVKLEHPVLVPFSSYWRFLWIIVISTILFILLINILPYILM